MTAPSRPRLRNLAQAALALPLAIAMVASLVPANAAAQVPDLIDISGQYMPGATVPDEGPTKAQIASYDATLNGPIPLSDETFLIPGLNYHVDSISYSGARQDLTQLRAFHSLDFSLLFVQLLPKDWSLSARVATGLAGDYRQFDSGMVRVNALVMATHSFSDRFVLGGGGIASYSFGSFLPLPALYLDWKPYDELRIETFLPAFLNVKILPHDRIEFGLHAEFAGNAYAVRDARIRESWPCIARQTDDLSTFNDETRAQPSACLDSIAYSVGSAGPTFNLRLFETVWLNAFGGFTFFRRFEPQNAEGDLIGDAQSLPNDFLIRVGATWRVPEF